MESIPVYLNFTMFARHVKKLIFSEDNVLKIVYCSPYIIHLGYGTAKRSNARILQHTVIFLCFTFLFMKTQML